MKTQQQAANKKGASPYLQHPMYAQKQPNKRVKDYLLKHTINNASRKSAPEQADSSESESDSSTATLKMRNVGRAKRRGIFSESSDSSDAPEPPKKK